MYGNNSNVILNKVDKISSDWLDIKADIKADIKDLECQLL